MNCPHGVDHDDCPPCLRMANARLRELLDKAESLDAKAARSRATLKAEVAALRAKDKNTQRMTARIAELNRIYDAMRQSYYTELKATRGLREALLEAVDKIAVQEEEIARLIAFRGEPTKPPADVLDQIACYAHDAVHRDGLKDAHVKVMVWLNRFEALRGGDKKK